MALLMPLFAVAVSWGNIFLSLLDHVSSLQDIVQASREPSRETPNIGEHLLAFTFSDKTTYQIKLCDAVTLYIYFVFPSR